jgi:hypothetical protein
VTSFALARAAALMGEKRSQFGAKKAEDGDCGRSSMVERQLSKLTFCHCAVRHPSGIRKRVRLPISWDRPSRIAIIRLDAHRRELFHARYLLTLLKPIRHPVSRGSLNPGAQFIRGLDDDVRYVNPPSFERFLTLSEEVVSLVYGRNA